MKSRSIIIYSIIAICALLGRVAPAFGSSSQAVAAESQEEEVFYYPSILLLEDDDEIAALEATGVIIWYRRADMALALVPEEALDRVSARTADSGGARRVRKPRRAVPVMDVAKQWFEADALHTGAGLPAAYAGRGVVVGFCDMAFDPNHINFRDADGKSRVKKLVNITENRGLRTILESPEEIAAWTTDNSDAYHATHVAGIMAGGYAPGGYSGMAPEAEIVAATCQFYDMGILASCEEILEYGRRVGRPVVINLSLGSYNGPHDGTSLFCRYLDLIAREAVVCIAAGNAGDSRVSYQVDFTEESPMQGVYLSGNDWIHYDIQGFTDVWSRDVRQVDVRFSVFDGDTRRVVYTSPVTSLVPGERVLVASGADPDMAAYMAGEVWAEGRIDALNGRWVTEIEYHTVSVASATASEGRWARYYPALEFSAAPGVHADIHADGQYSFFNAMPGYTAPGNDLSVSDIATGENVIVVGMYNNKNRLPTLGGTDRVFSFEPFTVNAGSGYGVLADGRVLPHTVAPGGGIVSSCNRYYNLAHPENLGKMHAVAEVDGEKYYWASDAGTSMATPYVAGAVATWLEALPGLTPAEIRAAIAATNFRDYPDPLNPRHGDGWFRPVEGLQYLLASTGITVGSVESGAMTLRLEGDEAVVLNPRGEAFGYEIYSADGRRVAGGSADGPVVRINIASLPKGLYVLSAVSGSDKGAVKFMR
ncbi:MAG: S8 family peptidase [Muribaculaceae bacterium]|nr:S8 family peptidase [Muribaculaceae bacterium]